MATLVDTRPSPSGPRYEAYFLARVGEPDANGCIPWHGPVNAKGYGVLGIAMTGHSRMAHRYAYESRVGPIPQGFTIDHLCFNRRCVNPAHLELVTRLENVRRGRVNQNDQSETCKHGHRFDNENTHIAPDGRRACRTCARERMRAWRAGR